MDPFVAFLIFAGLLVLENLAARSWLPLYFRAGLPVFYRRVSGGAADQSDPLPMLVTAFQSVPEHPSLQFRRLDPRTIAIRERLFENRAGFRYLPVMHSTLRRSQDGRFISLTGYLNYWVLFALVYAALRSAADRSFIPVAVLVLVLLVISFLAQVSLNNRVLAALQSLGSPGRPSAERQ